MKSSIVPAEDISTVSSNDARPSWLDAMARRLLLKQLTRIREGQLTVLDGERAWTFGTPSERLPRAIVVTMNQYWAWRDIALGGSSAAGEAYMNGGWEVNDLTGLVRLFLRNREVLDGLGRRFRLFAEPLRRLVHWLSRNSRSGSRRNIAAHYDIGNDLFELFLDPTMMYSSAYYPAADWTLHQASVAKLDRVCRKLELTPEHHLLEIGTGWGGLAIHAARHYGCRVTTTTISRQQYELALQRVRDAGLDHQVEVLFSDYRELEGKYDRLVSIEMVEAVGHQYLDGYFAQCGRLLNPQGMMLIQAITIAERRYEQAVKSVDFIKRFIFPGGFLPSLSGLANAVGRNTDMSIQHSEDIGLHYARTLRDWRSRFHEQLHKVRALGYSERFIRMWDFYLCYSEGGFAERQLGTVQMLFAKPDAVPGDISY